MMDLMNAFIEYEDGLIDSVRLKKTVQRANDDPRCDYLFPYYLISPGREKAPEVTEAMLLKVLACVSDNKARDLVMIVEAKTHKILYFKRECKPLMEAICPVLNLRFCAVASSAIVSSDFIVTGISTSGRLRLLEVSSQARKKLAELKACH